MAKRRRPTTTQLGLGHTWRQVRARVLARDGYRCYLCGRRADSVDHVVPRAAGGPRYDERNLRACCRSCNSRKGPHGVLPPLPTGKRRVWPGAIGSGPP